MLEYTNGCRLGSWVTVWKRDKLNIASRSYDYDGNLIDSHESEGNKNGFTPEEIAQAEETIKTLPKPAHRCDNLYIRFGMLPKDGKSRNWASGEKENGISAYNARYHPIDGTYSRYGSLPGAAISHLMRGSTIWLLTGDEVGTGSDGEPLLGNVKKIATLKLNDDGNYEVKRKYKK